MLIILQIETHFKIICSLIVAVSLNVFQYGKASVMDEEKHI